MSIVLEGNIEGEQVQNWKGIWQFAKEKRVALNFSYEVLNFTFLIFIILRNGIKNIILHILLVVFSGNLRKLKEVFSTMFRFSIIMMERSQKHIHQNHQ
jgi:hypothetical protein